MNQPTTVWPRLQRGLGWAAAISGIAALYIGLVGSPSEQFLGDLVRILYVHAGAAWVAYLAFGVTALASLVFLWRRQRAWDRLGLASAEIGVVLASLTLGSGMIWGRAAQGWWWRWEDPRLVLTLFMWFLYVAYLILRQFTEGERRALLSAVLAVIGVPTMILNHVALDIFQQRVHPQRTFIREGGPAASEPIVSALLLSVLAYTLLYAWLLLSRVRLEQARDVTRAKGLENG
ncbi:MAG: cytochrome c biogenesis protein CcsA [Caldilineae bacterium]|nr:cytochrome c biogenesis protein CcsA [Caldilineae bacterium]